MPWYSCTRCPKHFRRPTPKRGRNPTICPDCVRRAHAEQSREAMRAKRAANPAYCEDERDKLRERMRKTRKQLHKQGLNNRGKPYRSPVWAVYAALRSYARTGR